MSNSLDDFEALIANSEKPVFVMWSGSFCKPCKDIKPVFIENSKDNEKAVFVIVDVNEGLDISVKYNITSIPIFKVFKKGKIIDEMMGTSKKELKDFIDKHQKNLHISI